MAAAKTNRLLPVLNCVAVGQVDLKSVRLVATDLDSTYNSTSKTQEGPYPDWEAILPKGKPALKTGLTVDVVLKIFNALKAAGVKSVNVDISGPKGAWMLHGTSKAMAKVTGLLMPCLRGDEK